MRFLTLRFLIGIALVATVSAAAPLALVAQQSTAPHYPTSEDLRHLKAISAPQLSPDGKQALFTVTDSTADGAKSHLWIVAVPAGTEKARQLTFSPPTDKRGEHNGAWAPDGSAIFFLAKRDAQTQLFRLDLRGGEAAPYDLKIMPPVDESKEKDAVPPPGADKSADKKAEPAEKKSEEKSAQSDKDKKTEPLPIDVSGYAFSYDGKWLAVWAHDPETPGEKKQKDAKADASWVDHDKHGTRLYLAALKPDGMVDGAVDGALRPVAIPPDVHRAAWSQATARLLVFTQAPNNAADLGPSGAAWLVDAATPDQPARLDAVPATAQGGAFTHDGDAIVFAAQTPEDAPPGYDELFNLSLAPGAKPIRLTAGFAGQVNAADLQFPSESTVVAEAEVGTRTTPVLISRDAGRPPDAINLNSSVVTGLTTNRAQTGWLWLADSAGQPVKLCYAQHLADSCSTLPTPDLAPANLLTVTPKLVSWPAAAGGGLAIEGLLYLPPDTGSAKVPLIVDVHGGPFGAWEDRNDPFAAFLVGHGWAVLRPNPRGSSNYGVKFAAANKNDLGGGDYRDVMAGADYVLAHYPLDPARTALMGYSYGGEMAAFVEGKTDRFKAVISEAPVIDQFSEYGNEKDSWYDRWYFGKPWEHHEDAWRQSPLAGATGAKTPFLLIQGQSDTTDPLGQSEEMYRALRQQGVPAELVTYPREDHGPLAIGIFGRPSPEPWHGYDARQRIVEFLDKAFGAGTP
ncbi:MAG: prolyl oligopeptidase family serine peptidase, partial [Terracidiphilus sp.]